MTADAGAVRVADNDALVEWLHVHAEHLDNPIDVGVVRAAADEIERLTGIVLCLMRRWPDCNTTNCGQPCRPPGVTATNDT